MLTVVFLFGFYNPFPQSLFVSLSSVNPCMSCSSKSPSSYIKCSLVCLHSVLYYCTVLYCTVLYCTVLYCTVLYCTVLYCTVLYCTVLYCTVLYCTLLYSTVLYCTLLYSTVLYCTLLISNPACPDNPVTGNITEQFCSNCSCMHK